MSPLQGNDGESPILAKVEDGHALLDPYTTLLGPGIPLPWKIICDKPPPQLPFDGLPLDPSTSETKPKRRKLNREINENEQANIAHHNELREWLPDAIESARIQWKKTRQKTWYSDSRVVINPTTDDPGSSVNVRQPQDLVAWGREVREIKGFDDSEDEDSLSDRQPLLLSGSSSNASMPALFEKVHMNRQQTIHILQTPATSFMIPPQAGFLMADMEQWHGLLSPITVKNHFNCVIMDPPWRSKSVRRSAHYEEMDMYDLYKIRLPELLSSSALQNPVLVGVWVTNHAKCRRFVKEKLLPAWGITNIADWYWVKITSGGDGEEEETGGLPVWDFDGTSPRRCYEGLILGYYNPNQLPIDKELPDKRAFLSVMLEHSRKPLVTGGSGLSAVLGSFRLMYSVSQDLLRPYLQGESTRVLELFSRYVPSGIRNRSPLPGSNNNLPESSLDSDFWLSVGNEPLKYNELVHWMGGGTKICIKGGKQVSSLVHYFISKHQAFQARKCRMRRSRGLATMLKGETGIGMGLRTEGQT